MKTVILCGGFGTRIRGVADDLPKPMISIGDRQILWHIMSIYSQFGHNDFVLCLGYKGDQIRDYFHNFRMRAVDAELSLLTGKTKILGSDSIPDWTVTLAETGLNSMTGTRVRRVRTYVDSGTFFLTYGDSIGDVDIDRLLDFHRQKGAAMTITGVRPPGRFGEIEVDQHSTVVGFNEKPNSTGGLISGGFFVCEPRVFDYLKGGDDVVLEKEPMKRLVEAGEMAVYEHEGFWQPMDTYREFTLLNDLWKTGNVPWIISND